MSCALPGALRGRRDAWLALAIALGCAGLLSTGVLWQIPFSKFIVGGLRVGAGDVPYRDFWSMYAPGAFYLNAGLFALFGREVAVSGLAACTLNGVSGALLFVWLRAAGFSALPAALLSVVYALTQWRGGPELTGYDVARPLLLVGWIQCTRYLARGAGGALLGAGGAFGVAAWFKHDVGAYAALGASGGLVLATLLCGERRLPAWLAPVRVVGQLAAGAALALLPVVLVLGWAAGPSAWDDLIRFPATDYRAVRTEPYPPWVPEPGPALAWLADPGDLALGREASDAASAWLLAYVPLGVLALAAVVAVRRRSQWPPARVAGLWLCAVSLVPFWLAAHVQQNTHLQTMALLCAPLLATLLAQPARCATRRLGLCAAAGWGAGLAIPAVAQIVWAAWAWPDARAVGLPGLAGVHVSAEQYSAYAPVARFVRERVPEGEPIYVGVWRHDAIVIGDPRLFVLTGRRSATRYHEPHPAVSDRPLVQEEIIADIERHNVRCVVLWKFGWPNARLDAIKAGYRARLPDVGSERLDAYLRSEFEVVAEHGEYAVLWRRGAGAR